VSSTGEQGFQVAQLLEELFVVHRGRSLLQHSRGCNAFASPLRRWTRAFKQLPDEERALPRANSPRCPSAGHLGQAGPPVARLAMLVMYGDDHQLTIEPNKHQGILKPLEQQATDIQARGRCCLGSCFREA
jgi:hypothetical protein